MRFPVFAALIYASSVSADEVFSFSSADFTGVDIVIVGEIHDNPNHHLVQAEIIGLISPTAVVFEMLTAEQAARVTDANITEPTLGQTLEWEQSGWPDFAIYAPIFAASTDAEIVGAAPSEFAASQARDDTIRAFGDGADNFGLTNPLSDAEQTLREAGMQDAHCGALPPEILPWFVEQQRFRDAVFARAALDAFDRLGGPVVVITGNGHARTDWGVPVYLAHAAPDVTVLSIGQITPTPDKQPFDLWRTTSPVDRPDPCAAFK